MKISVPPFSSFRNALLLDDASNVNIAALDALFSAGGEALIGLRQVQNIIIRGCQPSTVVDTFLKVEGSKSRNIAVVGNNLSRVNKTAAIGPNVPEKTLSIIGSNEGTKNHSR